MNDILSRQIRAGSDPRTLPDYTALRDELSKLSHPARPDVDWHYAEKLCLSLFEQNGVELQTAAWYTLARAQRGGLSGLNDGLAILEALISHQWGTFWPQPVHARMEILSGLSQRLQKWMRTLSLNYSDLSPLYRAEQLLGSLGEVLQRLELKHLSQFDTLLTLMHNSAARLEKSEGLSASCSAVQPDSSLPVVVMSDADILPEVPADRPDTEAEAPARPVTEARVARPEPQSNPVVTMSDAAILSEVPSDSDSPDTEAEAPVRPVTEAYVARPEPQSERDILAAIPAPVKKWPSFIAGMGTMLVVCMVTVGGWHVLHRPEPVQTRLAAFQVSLPTTLTPAQRDTLRQQAPSAQTGIAETQQQLARLEQLSPGWHIDYSRQLIEQAQWLWPEQAKPLARQWRQQLNAFALPADNLTGWHQGMTTLQQLSSRLNGLDEQKGKYMTVSELKSVVFSAIQSFNQAIPVEEQLRVLSQEPPERPLPAAAQAQVEMHLKQLIARYALLTRPGMHDISDTAENPKR
jgi:type VI secretion system protein VasL